MGQWTQFILQYFQKKIYGSGSVKKTTRSRAPMSRLPARTTTSSLPATKCWLSPNDGSAALHVPRRAAAAASAVGLTVPRLPNVTATGAAAAAAKSANSTGSGSTRGRERHCTPPLVGPPGSKVSTRSTRAPRRPRRTTIRSRSLPDNRHPPGHDEARERGSTHGGGGRAR